MNFGVNGGNGKGEIHIGKRCFKGLMYSIQWLWGCRGGVSKRVLRGGLGGWKWQSSSGTDLEAFGKKNGKRISWIQFFKCWDSTDQRSRLKFSSDRIGGREQSALENHIFRSIVSFHCRGCYHIGQWLGRQADCHWRFLCSVSDGFGLNT